MRFLFRNCLPKFSLADFLFFIEFRHFVEGYFHYFFLITCFGSCFCSYLSHISVPSCRAVYFSFLCGIDPFLDFRVVGIHESGGPVTVDRMASCGIGTYFNIGRLRQIQDGILADNLTFNIIAVTCVDKSLHIDADT